MTPKATCGQPRHAGKSRQVRDAVRQLQGTARCDDFASWSVSAVDAEPLCARRPARGGWATEEVRAPSHARRSCAASDATGRFWLRRPSARERGRASFRVRILPPANTVEHRRGRRRHHAADFREEDTISPPGRMTLWRRHVRSWAAGTRGVRGGACCGHGPCEVRNQHDFLTAPPAARSSRPAGQPHPDPGQSPITRRRGRLAFVRGDREVQQAPSRHGVSCLPQGGRGGGVRRAGRASRDGQLRNAQDGEGQEVAGPLQALAGPIQADLGVTAEPSQARVRGTDQEEVPERRPSLGRGTQRGHPVLYRQSTRTTRSRSPTSGSSPTARSWRPSGVLPQRKRTRREQRRLIRTHDSGD